MAGNGRVYGKCQHRTKLITLKIKIMERFWSRIRKAFAIHIVSLRTFFYCGIKVKEWDNVHHEIETTESGRYYAFGEARMYHFTEKWLYIIGIPIWRLHFNCKDKGLYEP